MPEPLRLALRTQPRSANANRCRTSARQPSEGWAFFRGRWRCRRAQECRMRKKVWLILAMVAIAGGSLVYVFFVRKTGQENNRIRISGNIEVTEVQISFKTPGRVKQRLADEGQL